MYVFLLAPLTCTHEDGSNCLRQYHGNIDENLHKTGCHRIIAYSLLVYHLTYHHMVYALIDNDCYIGKQQRESLTQQETCYISIKSPFNKASNLNMICHNVPAPHQDKIKHICHHEPSQRCVAQEQDNLDANSYHRTGDFGLYNIFVLYNGCKIVANDT